VAGNPVDRPARQQIRHEREEQNDHNDLERMDPAKGDDLVDKIDRRAQSDDACNGRPSLVQQLPSIALSSQQRPEIHRSPFAGIFHPVADRVQHRHGGLEEESEVERPARTANQILPETIPPFVHVTRKHRWSKRLAHQERAQPSRQRSPGGRRSAHARGRPTTDSGERTEASSPPYASPHKDLTENIWRLNFKLSLPRRGVGVAHPPDLDD
jgi:hypothetical protein